MSFIPGRFLNPGVAQQVNARQEILGNRERLMADGVNPETFSFFLKKVPFIKLTSAIDISNTIDTDTGSPTFGQYIGHTNTEASKFILDNGVKSAKEGDIPGYEQTDSLGYRPKPGITGMQLNTHNRFGSLRTATVSFEVHSVDQLDQYEQLFMRPGYSALLEWGNSYYLDNKTKKVQEVTELLSDRFLNRDGLDTKLSVYVAIDELRTRYSYNYDAMYGLLKNFRWSIRPDGGYSCTVDLVSVGTIIESLSINSGVTLNEKLQYVQNIKEKEELEDAGIIEDIEYIPGTSIPVSGQLPEISVFGQGELDRRDLTEEQQAFLSFLQSDLFPEELVKRTVAENFTEKIGTFFANLFSGDEEKEDYTKEVEYTAFIGLKTFGKELLGSNIVYNVSTGGEFRFNLATQAFFERSKLPELEDLPVYRELTNYSKTVRDKNTGRLYNYVFELLEVPETPVFQQVKLVNPANLFFWNLEYRVVIEEAPEGTVGEASTEDAAAVAAVEEVDLSGFLRDFAPELNTQIHFKLNQIREAIKKTGINVAYKEQNGSSMFTAVSVRSEYNTVLCRAPIQNGNDAGTSNGISPPVDNNKYYIQLGAFLDILNIYIPGVNVGISAAEKLFRLHTDKSLVHRHKTLENLHASIDPDKFILPQSQQVDNGSKNLTPRGDILNIFVEIGYLEELVNSKLFNGELKIYEMLTDMLSSLNIALGNINSFELQYFENTFTFHIIDRELIDPNTFIESDLVRLELIGKNSTLLNLNLTSKLSPAIGAQLAIAAQADPVSNGIEGTGWSKFNKGLKDRYIPEKVEDLEKKLAAQEESEQKLQEQLARVFLFLDAMYYRRTIGSTGINIPSVATEYAVLCKILLNNEVKAGKDFGTIIPYELTLELEGMSGFEVMRSFVINENIIPRVYRNEEEGIAFLITGLTHTISAERWTVGVKAQIYNTNTKGLASVDGKLRLDVDEVPPKVPDVPSEDTTSSEQTPEWPYYSDSDSVPDFVWDPSTASGPSIRGVNLNSYIKNEYLPALDSVQGYSKGLKLLATVMTYREGFYPKSRSYRTNNPGNVGNTDIGKNNTLDTLQKGVEAQMRYLTRVLKGQHTAYPLNRDKDIKPYYSPEIAANSKTYGLTPYLPGYKFTPYKGTLEQFIKIYSTGARGGNGYLSDIISYFKANGYDVDEKTTIEEIDRIA